MPKKQQDKIRVVELFAGVGGFRVGLEGYEGRSASSNYAKKYDSPYEVVWSNQWEPSTRVQHASDVYVARFGSEGHVNEDITDFPVEQIPDHDMLVGGFPCQDYSVARTLNQAEGLEGKKGVLWWAIHRILKEKGTNKPKLLFLENVDRLLKSPASQRGRDFAVMIRSLAKLGYVVEWRVINAAEYGMPQRRRRVFILAYHESSVIAAKILNADSPTDWLLSDGITAEAFPVRTAKNSYNMDFLLDGELDEVSDGFPMSIYDEDESGKKASDLSPFLNCGLLVGTQVTTIRVEPAYDEKLTTLGEIIYRNGSMPIPKEFFLEDYSKDTWRYLKGAKKDNKRTTKSGFTYNYNEGPMAFPDSLDKPSRTIITGEGGSTPSRFKHVIEIEPDVFRRLIPEELEKLNMFPPGHTKLEGISDVKRAFFMGNALVVGVVEEIGKVLAKRWRNE